jgi:hypothetical protein
MGEVRAARVEMPTPPKRRFVAAAGAAVEWYLATVYRRWEGPGVLSAYCDPARVGAFAVDPVSLGAGDEAALFKLLVAFVMYQNHRDVDVMRRQRSAAPEDAALITSRTALAAAIELATCPFLRSPRRLETACKVLRHSRTARYGCRDRPRTACPTKIAARTIGRMADLGKAPISATLRLASVGGLTGLLRSVARTEPDPRRRASSLVRELARFHRIKRKLASMYVSALSVPELAPGCTPWWPRVDGHELVVVDANVRRAIVAFRGRTSSYDADARWVALAADAIALDRLARGLPRRSPRIVQQALYWYASRSNRVAAGDPCAREVCGRCEAKVCPFAHAPAGRGV